MWIVSQGRNLQTPHKGTGELQGARCASSTGGKRRAKGTGGLQKRWTSDTMKHRHTSTPRNSAGRLPRKHDGLQAPRNTAARKARRGHEGTKWKALMQSRQEACAGGRWWNAAVQRRGGRNSYISESQRWSQRCQSPIQQNRHQQRE